LAHAFVILPRKKSVTQFAVLRSACQVDFMPATGIAWRALQSPRHDGAEGGMICARSLSDLSRQTPYAKPLPGKVREDHDHQALSPALFLSFTRCDPLHHEMSGGFAYGSLCGMPSPTGC
jgi:hypothetical protein